MSFEIPSDLSALNDAELEQALNDGVAAFNELAARTEVDTDHLSNLEALATFAEDARAEQARRAELATQTVDRVAQLAAKANGRSAQPADDGEVEASAAETETEVEASANSPARRPTINISSALKSRGSLPLTPRTVEFTASAQVNGYVANAPLELDDVTAAIQVAAKDLKLGGNNGAPKRVAQYSLPFSDDLVVQSADRNDAPHAMEVLRRAADQSRLPQGDLVASGGWCAPSETVFDITSLTCADMQWSVPEVLLNRGGLTYFKPPALDAASLAWIHSEMADIAGQEKPCFKIPCEDPESVRCAAVGICLEAGILSDRFFPEQTAYYRDLALVGHEILTRRKLFNDAAERATIVTFEESFGAFSAIYNAVALQVADYTERYNLCDTIGVEVVLPWYARNMMLADIARRNGVSIDEVNPNVIAEAFRRLGVAIQFAKGLFIGDVGPIGNDTPATEWPGGVEILLYAAGTLQLGRSPEINLGVIYDSEKFRTNDFTALFSEDCVALIDRSPEIRLLRVPTCADGRTGEQVGLSCPPPDFESPGSPESV